MLLMLAQRENVEIVRTICEWLVDVYQSDLKKVAAGKGANKEQSEIAARNGAANARALAERINDRNCYESASRCCDVVFQRYYNAGPEKYAQAQVWFANELRTRFRNDT
jgi:c-di-GMP-related signal transduction protein